VQHSYRRYGMRQIGLAEHAVEKSQRDINPDGLMHRTQGKLVLVPVCVTISQSGWEKWITW
jgi:hypothetical protein